MEIGEEINNNSRCSICGKCPIVGLRYKCLECPMFELCEQCEIKNGEKHGHQLLIIRKNSDLKLCNDYLNAKKELKKLTISNEPKKNDENYIDITKYTSICTNLRTTYITKNNNNFLPIEVILKNPGPNKWPFPCYFVCDEELSQIKGDKVKLSQNESNEYKFIIKIILPNVKETVTYKSVWQLRNEKGEKFGEKFAFKIKVFFDKRLVLKNNYKNKKGNEYDLNALINEIKKKPFIADKFTVNSIRNALLRTKGNKEGAVRLLITQKNNKGETLI